MDKMLVQGKLQELNLYLHDVSKQWDIQYHIPAMGQNVENWANDLKFIFHDVLYHYLSLSKCVWDDQFSEVQ